MSVDDPHLHAFTAAMKTRSSACGLAPTRPSLDPPGAETARLEGHGDEVTALAVLPDGRLASGVGDKTIRLWNAATGAESARLEGHRGKVRALAVLPDGRLASGADDRTIRLWDAATGAQIAWLDLDSAIRSLCWLPQARLLVAGDTRGRLHWLELT